ncbi:hypothetical protein BH23GEM9_BH23GEM9_04620 [soil metagenome]
MTAAIDAQRWRRICQLFDELVELDAAAIADRLRVIGAADPDLQRIVERLLAADSAGETRLARINAAFALPHADAERERDADPLKLAGRTISHFTVVEAIAAGGMGVVYRAEDTRLRRTVALKFPLPAQQLERGAKERFLHEARSAGTLDHPNICSIFETGETEDGHLFLAMPLYDGETLKARLARDGALPIVDALAIARQIADGLGAAHRAGIVHRDVKPANVMLLRDGTVKILDFGLAKVRDLTLTETRARVGTISYMAPEQIQGQPIDGRADLWALGVITYEMLTGRCPFRGEYDISIAHSILNTEPVRASLVRREIPADLDDTVWKLLRKEPAARYGATDQVAVRLAANRGAPEQESALSDPITRVRNAVTHTLYSARAQPGATGVAAWARSRAFVITAVTLVIATAAVMAYARTRSAARTPPAPMAVAHTNARPAVAVMPFRATDGDLAFWREGMVDLLSFNLEGIGDLRKIDPQAVLTAWHAVVGGVTPEDGAAVGLEVGRRVGAHYVVIGSAVRTGGNVQLTAEVYDVTTRRSRGSAHIRGEGDSLQTLVDALTIELVRLNRVPTSGQLQPVNISRVTTTSVPALKAYLAGEQHYRRSRWQDAAAEFQRAVELDSTFARALFRLGGSYVWSAGGPLANEYYQKAARFAAGLPERDALLLEAMVSRDISLLETLTLKYPDDADGWYQLADRAFHQGGVALLPASVFRDAFEKALVLAPYYGEVRFHLLEDAFIRLDSARARVLTDGYQAADFDNAPCPGYRIVYDLAWGNAGAVARARAALDTIGFEALSCGGSSAYMIAPAAVEKIGRHRRAVIEGSIPGTPGATVRETVQARLMRGELRGAHRSIAHAYGYSRTAPFAARYTAMLNLSGFPDTSAVAHAKAVLAHAAVPAAHFWLGAFAVAEERWADVESAGLRIDAHVRARAAAGDSADARESAALAPVLRTYAALRRRPTTDLAEFETALSGLPCCGLLSVSAFLRYQIAVMLFEQRKLDEAQRYFESFYHYDAPYFVPAQFFLAQIDESRGRTSEARAHYELFAWWWADSDPELQPWVRQARAALARLASGGRRE